MSRKKRIIRLVIILVILTAVIVAAVAYVKKTYTINKVYVEGNIHYTQDQIKEIVMEGPLGDNSLFLSLKYRNKGIQDIPFVDVIDVDIVSADTIKISVIEKMLTGYVRFLDTYMYFDKDGYVVESSSEITAGVPQVSGLEFDRVVIGEPLPVRNPEIFNAILTITKLMNKYQLDANKIYFSRSEEVTLYFEHVKVSLGQDYATLEDKLMRLPELLPSLEGREGTLRMESYDDKGTYTFKPD